MNRLVWSWTAHIETWAWAYPHLRPHPYPHPQAKAKQYPDSSCRSRKDENVVHEFWDLRERGNMHYNRKKHVRMKKEKEILMVLLYSPLPFAPCR